MQINHTTNAILSVLISSIPATALAAPSVGARFETFAASTYVFRGVPQYKKNHHLCLQATAWVDVKELGPGTFSTSLWNADALIEHSNQGGFQLELDASAQYAFNVTDSTGITLGYTAYLYPNLSPVDGAHEVWAGVSQGWEGFTLGVNAYAEIVRLQGVYANMVFSRGFEMGDFVFTPSVTAGLAGYKGTSVFFNDLSVALSSTWNVSEMFYMLGSVNYSFSDHPVLSGTFVDRSSVWGGIGAGIRL